VFEEGASSNPSLTNSVSISDSAPGSPQRVSVTGTGTYIQLTPTNVNFGSQPLGTKSLAAKITLTNKGSVPVSVTSNSVTGANAGDFAETDASNGLAAREQERVR
jgi:hypothetical protein